jgi:hypothetical protein
VPLWGSTQTTASLGQCSCACCSLRKADRTAGDCPQAVQDSTRAIITSPEPRLGVSGPREATRCNLTLVTGISLTALSGVHHSSAPDPPRLALRLIRPFCLRFFASGVLVTSALRSVNECPPEGGSNAASSVGRSFSATDLAVLDALAAVYIVSGSSPIFENRIVREAELSSRSATPRLAISSTGTFLRGSQPCQKSQLGPAWTPPT